jgi:hypothetical protein
MTSQKNPQLWKNIIGCSVNSNVICPRHKILGCERPNAKANNEWANTMASGDSPCISPWNEEANKFSHVTWRNIDWLRWLKENMVNRMPNGRFLISSCDTKANIFFSCVMKRYENSLVGCNGWMRRWPMRNSHAFLDKMKRLANTFPSDMKKDWLIEMPEWGDGQNPFF